MPTVDPSLKERARLKLEGSGIGPNLAYDLGYLAASKAPSGFPQAGGGILIPYHDADGNLTGFSRFRYLETQGKKALRYGQAKGSRPELYLPRNIAWTPILADTSHAIIITEGEFKAAKACAEGFPTLGIGGVRCWQDGPKMLPALEAIKWKGRRSYVAFDSDAIKNPQVMRAENELARALMGKGAEVYILRLPELPGVAKVGLDDYLIHPEGGAVGFQALLDGAQLWSQFEMLHKLNEEVVLLEDLSRIYRLENKKIITAADFQNVSYADWTYPDGKKTILAPRAWLGWPGRAKAKGLTYAPGQPDRYQGSINTWPGWGCEPKKGNVDPWLDLLQHLFLDDPEAMRWFIQWCAYPLQHPGVKMYTASLLWGRAKGTGKTAIFYALGRIYGDNFLEIKNHDLAGNFNTFGVNRSFVYGDEINANDSHVNADYLKGLITEECTWVNEKFVPAYKMINCVNYGFSSNHSDALFLEKGDRRFFIHEVLAQPLPDEFYHKTFDSWLKGSGPSHLFDYLLHVNTSDFHPYARAPMTRAKEEMIESSRSEVGRWVASILDCPDLLKINGNPVKKLWTAGELLEFYDPQGRKKVTAKGVSAELKNQGMARAAAGACIRTPFGQVRLWTFDPKLEKASTSEVGRIYDQEHQVFSLHRGYQ